MLSFWYFLSGPLNDCGLICRGDVSFVHYLRESADCTLSKLDGMLG